MHIATPTEVANAVLRDTPQAYEQGVPAEEKAKEHTFTSEELRNEYIKGFNLSIEFIGGYREFVRPLRESKQIQVTLHYRYGTPKALPDGRMEVPAMPYAVWQCVCGKELENDNLYNSVLHTGCMCGRVYTVDWRHGFTPRVELLSKEKSTL